MGALTASAALGANATVVLAASPAVLALAYLVVRLAGSSPKASMTLLAGLAGAVVAFSIPFAPWYLESVALQAPSLPGLSVDDQSPFAGLFLQGMALGLPTPLAVVGLEPPHAPSAMVSKWAFISWGFVLAILILRALSCVRSGRQPMAALMGFLAVAALNAAIVVATTGLGGYGLYKWSAVLIPLALPVLIAYWLSSSTFVGGRPKWLAGLGSAVVVVSASMAFAGGLQIGERGYVASPRPAGSRGKFRSRLSRLSEHRYGRLEGRRDSSRDPPVPQGDSHEANISARRRCGRAQLPGEFHNRAQGWRSVRAGRGVLRGDST